VLWRFVPDSFITARTAIDGISPAIPIRGGCSSDIKPTCHREAMRYFGSVAQHQLGIAALVILSIRLAG
jgi:hypothetical protein